MHESPQEIPPPVSEDSLSPWGPSRYGDSFADVYDDWYDDISDAHATAEFVAGFGEGQKCSSWGLEQAAWRDLFWRMVTTLLVSTHL